ncbi:hypothetical protein WDU94_005764, partial [Cyamophila willieti]
VEIVGSQTSPDVRTTITQAGCGGCTVDTQPVSGGTNGIMTSNNGILGSAAAGDESDYYTPDEPCTTILSPVQELVESQSAPNPSSTTEHGGGNGGTPILKNNNWNTSLPGTPLSTASHRSSGDSYSSSSSPETITYV